MLYSYQKKFGKKKKNHWWFTQGAVHPTANTNIFSKKKGNKGYIFSINIDFF